jgi:hypothetical protein
VRIKLWVEDVDSGDVLEELGECVTDSPARAVQMYDQDDAWSEKGYNADIRWKDITNQAASALGKIKSPKKSAQSRENGKLSKGWPKGKARKPKDAR